MTEMTRMNLNVPADVPEKLATLAGSSKRMGQYLTQVIYDLYAGKPVADAATTIQLLHDAVAGQSARISALEARLDRMGWISG